MKTQLKELIKECEILRGHWEQYKYVDVYAYEQHHTSGEIIEKAIKLIDLINKLNNYEKDDI